MTGSGQDRKRGIKFKCKFTRYGIYLDIGRNASGTHINRLIAANMKRRRRPGETGRLTPREYFLRDPLTIASLSFTFLGLLIFASFMILPRWIPRGNPEGVYDARVWLANCLCDDGRAFLVVTNHHTFQAVWSHPGADFINLEGTWEENPDGDSLLFELEDEAQDKAGYHVKCYWGGLEWTVETAETKRSFWFPRLISGVYCDYYNRDFWQIGIAIACITIGAGNILLCIIEHIRNNRQLKRSKTEQLKPGKRASVKKECS